MKYRVIFWAMVMLLSALLVARQWIAPNSPESAQDNQDTGISAPDDPEMQSAFNKARRTLDYFLGVAESPPPDTRGFALKVGVIDQGETEFFWIYPFQRVTEGFSGRINDEPKLVNNVFKGQVIDFQRSQIVDWTFEDRATDIMHGNYTGCVLLQREAPDNAEQFQALYGLNCDK